MKTPLITLALILTTLGTATSALAHGNGINARQFRQEARITQGIRSDELTRRETRQLVREQRGITRLEHNFRYDGYLGPAERRVLRHRLNHSGRHIYRLKHNRRIRHHRHHRHHWN